MSVNYKLGVVFQFKIAYKGRTRAIAFIASKRMNNRTVEDSTHLVNVYIVHIVIVLAKNKFLNADK